MKLLKRSNLSTTKINKNLKTIKIKKYWFVSAGMKYGWVKDGLESKGVGILYSDIKNNKFLKIEIVGEEYLLDCGQAIQFIEKYKSIFIAGGSTEVGVISRSLLRQITRGDEASKEEEVPPDQQQNEEDFNEGSQAD